MVKFKNRKVKGWAEGLLNKVTGSDSVLRGNLSVLYRGEELEDAIRNYRKGILKSYGVIAVITLIICIVSGASAMMDIKEVSVLERPDAGKDTKSVPLTVSAEYGGQSLEDNTVIRVSPYVMSDEEKARKLDEFAGELSEQFKGSYESSGEGYIVSGDLKLPDSDEEYGIDVKWESSDPVLISDEGHVDVIALSGREEVVTLTAMLRLDDVSREISFDMLIRDDPELYPLSIRKRIDEMTEALAKDDTGGSVALPGSLDGGIELSWNTRGSSNVIPVVMIGAVIVFVIYGSRHDKAKKKMKRYRDEVSVGFPSVVDKLVLLLNSGLTSYSALMRISSDSEDAVRSGGKAISKELSGIGRRVKNTNSSLIDEWKEFASRMESSDILRFCTILEDNMSKGSELCRKLENESDNLRDTRRKNIQKEIRMIDSKMMMPMLLMLFSLMLVTVAPAVMGF